MSFDFFFFFVARNLLSQAPGHLNNLFHRVYEKYKLECSYSPQKDDKGDKPG